MAVWSELQDQTLHQKRVVFNQQAAAAAAATAAATEEGKVTLTCDVKAPHKTGSMSTVNDASFGTLEQLSGSVVAGESPIGDAVIAVDDIS
jgi:spore coat protein U-like protein